MKNKQRHKELEQKNKKFNKNSIYRMIKEEKLNFVFF